MEPEGILPENAGKPIGGASGEVPVKLSVDVEAVKKLDTVLKDVKTTVKSLADELERASAASANLTGTGANSGGRTGGMVTHAVINGQPAVGAGVGNAGVNNGGLGRGMMGRWGQLFHSQWTPNPQGLGGYATGGLQSLGTAMGFGGAGGGFRGTGALGLGAMGAGSLAAGAAAFGAVGAQVTGMIDRRVDRNRAYSLSADQVGVRSRMLNGWSQDQYQKYREQIVGPHGSVMVDPNALIQFENQTGIGARYTRGAVGTGRALSGFTSSSQDILNAYASNFDPAAANRQFMMLGGMSMLGPGGTPRDFQATLGTWSQMFNLDNRFLSKGARLPGSVQRYRMGMSGISTEMQDLAIEYGMSQSTFREKGGKGRFDPTNEEHRKLIGVEDSYATQFDETQRRRMAREESMYARQNDNYAKLEENTQTMIGHLEGIEDKLSSLIGLRTGNRNWLNLGGRVMQAIGTGMMIAPGAGTLAGAALLGVGTAVSAQSGDPPENSSGSGTGSGGSLKTSSANDKNIMVPYGYSGNGPGSRIPLSDLKNKSTFKNLSSAMQDRLLAMMRENPDVGIGTGQRANTAEEFMKRYREVPQGQHDRTWNGKYWKLKSGYAAYAPPGRSMHEIGMAADLVGDIKWMNANAGRFGLKHFAGVNNEPWHVQPAELPNSRREYEAGRGTPLDNDFVAGGGGEEAMVVEPHDDMIAAVIGGGGGGGTDFTGMSIQQMLDSYLDRGPMGGGAPSVRASIGNTSQSPNSGESPGTFTGKIGEGAAKAAEAAYQAGWRGDDLINAVAIAGRESTWRNIKSKVSDDWGMWQINGVNRSVFEGMGYTKQDLLDPFKNAQVAYALYQQSGFNPWRASGNSSHPDVQKATGGKGFDPNGDPMWNTGKHYGEASAAVAALSNGGDPFQRQTPVNYGMPERTRRITMPVATGGAQSVTHQYQIDFAPVFKFEGMPETADLKKVAREAASYLREQADIALKRSE